MAPTSSVDTIRMALAPLAVTLHAIARTFIRMRALSSAMVSPMAHCLVGQRDSCILNGAPRHQLRQPGTAGAVSLCVTDHRHGAYHQHFTQITIPCLVLPPRRSLPKPQRQF